MNFSPADRRARRLLVSALALVFLTAFFGFGRWRGELDGGDALGYYLHLPSVLLYHDVGSYEKTLTAAHQEIRYVPDPKERMSNTEPAPKGRHIRWPLGVAVLSSPFFGMAHAWCLVSGQYPANGFSTPYKFMAGLAPLCFVLWGFWVLFGVLRRYFSLQTTTLTLLTLALATNLFYFAAFHNFMAHGFLFALVAWLLERTIRFWEQPGAANAAWLGVAGGLIALTRLHDALILLIPLLWGLDSWAAARERAVFLIKKARWLLLAAMIGAVLLIPQALYYKTVSGQWWWYAYGDERLDLLHPHLLGGWFDYKNGWLVYTPVMVFALIGIFRLRRFVRPALTPLLVVLPLHAYIAYSWWCWFYTNGFGSRPMVDLYPLLALPLAAFFTVNWRRLPVKAALAVLLVFFSALNIFQVWQFHNGLIWSEYENRAHYWAMFGQTSTSPAALIAWDSNESQPSEMPVFVKKLGENALDDSTGAQFVHEPRHGGQFALRMDELESGGALTTAPGDLREARPGDWVRVSVWAYVPTSTKTTDFFDMAYLTLTFCDAEGKRLRSRGIRIAHQIGNPEGSIWNSGATDQWGEAAFFVHLPGNFPPDGTVKAAVENPRKEKLLIDDLSVEFWRKR